MSMDTITHLSCGGSFYRDRNGRAICRACKGHVAMETFLSLGLSPMWQQGTLVTHNGERVSDGLSEFVENEDGTTTVVRFGMRLNTFTSRDAAESFAARKFWVYA